MRKLGIIVIVLFLALAIGGLLAAKSNLLVQTKPKVSITQPPLPTATVTPASVVETQSIFVPYWNLPTAPLPQYNQLYYFGVTANAGGLSKYDQGYENIQDFMNNTKSSNAYLVVRMLDTDTNIDVLKDAKAQQKIIDDTLQTAQKYGFKGSVLDLEVGVIPFSDVTTSINTFVQHFYQASQQNKLNFMVTVYGDVFYRKRPYDVKFLAANTDKILIMAYDFHKPKGLPGPNFPFAGKEKYDYDFQQMVTDYLQVAPANKLEVIFGMYGYDWLTDLQGRPTETATAIPLNDIYAKYVSKCDWKNCVLKRDPLSQENEIDYVDSSNKEGLIYHTVWFEDQKSVDAKKAFLKQKGIGDTGYWVYGYFQF